MLIFRECGPGIILSARASGELTPADCQMFLARLEANVQKYGQARVLLELDEFQGWDPFSTWGEPNFGRSIKNEVRRFAVVADKANRMEKARLAAGFSNARVFTPAQRQEAWQWVSEEREESSEKEPIRRLAYAKWLAAGRPPGDGLPFWVEAERELVQAS
jgi:hypothetical protein